MNILEALKTVEKLTRSSMKRKQIEVKYCPSWDRLLVNVPRKRPSSFDIKETADWPTGINQSSHPHLFG